MSFSLNSSFTKDPNQSSSYQVRFSPLLIIYRFSLSLPINIYLRYYHNDSARLRLFTTINERSRVSSPPSVRFARSFRIIVRPSRFWARTATHLFTRLSSHRLCHVVPLSLARREENGQAGGRARARAASGNGGPHTGDPARSSLAVHFGRTDFTRRQRPVTVVAAAAPRRIYVRFVIDEPEWCERGCTSVEGAHPTLSRASRGVSRDRVGKGRGPQVEETVADLSINGRLGPRLLRDFKFYSTCAFI